MNKVLIKTKNVAKKVGNVILNTGKVCVALVAAVATAEAAFVGAEMMQNDAALVGQAVKHKVNPEPVYTKKGVFSKKEVSTLNPLTGKIEPYNGNKLPADKKVIKVK